MTRYTVQCAQAAYSFSTLTVEGDPLEDALARAVRKADREGVWWPSRIRGPVFVNAIALGADMDLGRTARLDIPPAFIEIPPPRVIVTLSRGSVQNIEIESGTVTVEVRDIDTDPSGPPPLTPIPPPESGG